MQDCKSGRRLFLLRGRRGGLGGGGLASRGGGGFARGRRGSLAGGWGSATSGGGSACSRNGALGGLFLDGLGELLLAVGDLGEAEDALGVVPALFVGEPDEASVRVRTLR